MENFQKRSLLWWVSLNHYFPSVRPFVCVCVTKIITFSRQFFGAVTWKNARFTAGDFKHLKFLDFQVSKKRCPKVGLAFNTGRGRDPVLSPFWWTFSRKFKFTFYQKEFNLLGIWRKKLNWDNFRCSKTSGLMEFCITNATFGWLTQYVGTIHLPVSIMVFWTFRDRCQLGEGGDSMDP